MISPEQEALIGQVFESYLTQHHQEDLLQLLADTREERHCPLPVNAMTLFEANMEVSDGTLPKFTLLLVVFCIKNKSVLYS